ncbi:DUF397 domain-containing protein [Streptomyces platensis]
MTGRPGWGEDRQGSGGLLRHHAIAQTSTYTKSDNCVEVADEIPGKVLVRDSKDRDGVILHFSPAAWVELVEFSKCQSL